MSRRTKFLIFIVAVIAVYYVRQYWDGIEVRRETSAFAEEAVDNVTAQWQEAEFQKVQDPYLKVFMVNGVEKGDLAKSLVVYRTLGKRTEPAECAMQDFTSYRGTGENYIAANYTCTAQFEKDSAQINFAVRRFTVTGAWKISYFDVRSNYLQAHK